MTAWACGDSLDYFAVKVDPGKELMAQRILENRHILARVPTRSYEARVHRKSKRKITITRPWLAGLVFVAFPKGCEIPWFALRQRIHIIRGVIGMDHKPAKLDHQGLLRLFDDIVFSDAEVQAHKRTYLVGDRVRVTLGKFAGFEAKVVTAGPSEMTIMCQLFGRDMPMRIGPENMDSIEYVAA